MKKVLIEELVCHFRALRCVRILINGAYMSAERNPGMSKIFRTEVSEVRKLGRVF